MQDKMKRELYDKLPSDKIKISWNKRPIAMSLFLSFLKVDVERSTDHLGYDMGWTLYENKELKLKIGGGKVAGTELLNSLQYGIKRANPYNNYVNPFYLFDILTPEGQQFFLNYYSEEIAKIVGGARASVINLENELVYKRKLVEELEVEVEKLKGNVANSLQQTSSPANT